MQPLLNALLAPDFDLHQSIATIPASDLPATAESATTQLSSLARLADLCESIRLTTARMAAVQLLLTVAQSTSDLNTRRLAATAILRFNPQTFRAPKPPKDPPHNKQTSKPATTSNSDPFTSAAQLAAATAPLGDDSPTTNFTSTSDLAHNFNPSTLSTCTETPSATRAPKPSTNNRESPATSPSSPAGRPSVATGAAQQARGIAPFSFPARRAHEPHLPAGLDSVLPAHSNLLNDLNPFAPQVSPAALLTSRRGTALPATIPRASLTSPR